MPTASSRKQLTSRCQDWFPHEMTSNSFNQSSLFQTLRQWGRLSWSAGTGYNQSEALPVTSHQYGSVWSFFRSSDIISRENQLWLWEISAVFWGASLRQASASMLRSLIQHTYQPAQQAFVSFIFRAAKTENPVPQSFLAPKPNGNACDAGYTRT